MPDIKIADILSALRHGEFKVYYQPIVDTWTERVTMAEALLRWESPERGLLMPDSFLPQLVKAGLVSVVDANSEQQVYDMLRNRLKAGLSVVPIDSNVATDNFDDEAYITQIEQQLQSGEVPIDLLRFEIPGNLVARMTERRTRLLEVLQHYNAKVLIDDFGKGLSFGTMSDVDFQLVKIDRVFICHIGNRKTEYLLGALINMFHNMGAKVIAEGVEELRQVEFLRSVNCDYIQGYFFYKPMPAEDFLSVLDHQASLPEAASHAVDALEEQVTVKRAILDRQYDMYNKSLEQADVMHRLLNDSDIYLFEWDVKTHIDRADDAFAKAYGLPGNELLDMPEDAPLVHPDDLERFRNVYASATRGERSGSGHFRMKSPDGRRYIWFNKSFHTIFDHDHNPSKVFLAMQDCSDKFALRMLEKREELFVKRMEIITFNYTFDDDTLDFFFVDNEGEVQHKVIESYLATPSDEMEADRRVISRHINLILHDPQTPREGTFDMELQMLHRHMRFYYTVIENDLGTEYAIIGQAEDINRSRDRLNEIIHSQQSLIQMLSGLGKLTAALIYQDLQTGQSRILSIDPAYAGCYTDTSDALERSAAFANQYVKPVYIDGFKAIMNWHTWKERLKTSPTLQYEYEDTVLGWIRLFILPTEERDEHGELKSAIVAPLPIDLEKHTIAQFKMLSETDGLTSLRNRASGEHKVSARLDKGMSGTFVIIDVDKFKEVNDTFGHAVGDQLLITVANLMRRVNPDGINMRLGGDEFAMYLDDVISPADVYEVMSLFFRLIEDIRLDGVDHRPFAVSAGAVCYDGSNEMDFDTIYRNADRLLYESKKVEGCKLHVM